MDGTVALVALVMAVGAVGTVLPLVPGLGLAWLAALGYGLVEGFDAAGGPGLALFAAITVVAVAGFLAGWVVPHRSAVASGAHRGSVWLGVAGAVAGFFLVPVVGLPLGGMAGIYVGEHLRTRDAARAWRATRATLAGFGIAALLQMGAALAMIVLWVAWVLAA
ncbi:MAG TPA: DUF456 domain-containing protein [Acidimicrobiales bacterium]|nr:DUF456 domain-containing protein [Acidimicrobiales bacterium]